MPPDIRSFFGGKSSQDSNASAAKAPVKEDPSAARKRRSRKVVEDSDDDEEAPPPKAPTPKAKPQKEQKVEAAKGEPVTTSAYFASTKKRGQPPKAKNAETTDSPQPQNGASSNRNADKSTPKTKKTKEIDNPAEIRGETPPSIRKERSERYPAQETSKKVHTIDADDNLGGDDIFAAEYRKAGKGDDEYIEDDEDKSDFEELVVRPATAASEEAAKKKRASMPDVDDDVVMKDEPKASPKGPKVSPTKNGRKRKSEALLDKDEDSELFDDSKKTAQQSKTASSSPATKKQKATPSKDRPESKEIQEIFDSIPTVRPPTPPPPSGEPRKFNFAAQAQRSQPPPGAGTKEIPVGAENCLAGLSFVFTGILDTLGREEGISLVKRYGGKVTTAPSSKTSYVVLGSDAGPKKLETIKKYNLKTINEDGLFELIRRLPANGGSGKAAEQYAAKKKAEEEKIREMAAEIDKEEKQKAKAIGSLGANAPKGSEAPSGSQGPRTDDRLWTTKYAPTSINMICGNKGVVEKLQFWLRNWRKNAKLNFTRPGKDGSGIYRAVMLHGPPGIGKTTAAHLVAKLEGYDVVETNASDTRNKKLLETGLLGVLDTTSLQGYFAGEGKKVESEKKNLVLIMDEVDGMSAGDRGGVGALAAIAKKTRVPLILICNDRRLPKMKPFDHVTYELPFRRPTAEQIRARLSTICFREGLKIPPQVLDSLIEGTHSDIRQVINMLATVKLDQQQLDYDKGKEMSKAWEKHVILKPWDIVSKILSPQMFSPSSKSTLSDKIELYFNDHEFSYLMLQENYLKTNPTLASGYQGKERSLKLLELVDNAAASISDGDLVDSMIHGSQQQWSLMPVHAAFSFVRPASFTAGNMTDRPAFTNWLGQNSKQGKLARYVKEIQGHMRLRSFGDRDEVRQQYIPALWDKLIRRLMDEGKDSVESVIDLMDSYFLTRDDWDAMVELGVGPMDESNVKIDSQTKATFTRIYNQRSHPLPFMKASSVVAPKRLPKVKPDIEDAIDESDEEEEILDPDTRLEDESEELDLKKDKYVKVPKKPAAQKGAAGKGKKAAKANKADDDDFIDDDEEEEKPKKRGRKPKAKA
ncbi:replication factor RFC1 C terminal domain-containing protein [Thermoascus aurantiacus ATCC 26904]